MFPNTPTSLARPKKRQIPSSWKENETPTTRTAKSRRTDIEGLSLFPATPIPAPSGSNTPITTLPPLSEKKNRPTYRNGYAIDPKPQAQSTDPYQLIQRGRHKLKAFAFEAPTPLTSQPELNASDWTAKAREAGFITEEQSLRKFQVDAANHILARDGDLCVIAPTGSGKSLVWALPLLAQENGISLVIVPFTSLGHQGELRNYGGSSISSHFLYSGNKKPELLAKVAKGEGRQIIYICPEMLQSPTMAQVLHAPAFKSRLSAIYLDEAHVVHESKTWRPAYTHLHLLRRVCGLEDVPMVAISATLPTVYRTSLSALVGLRADYKLINLGNSRHDLSSIIKNMEYDVSSFRDIEFFFSETVTLDPESMPPAMLFTDDIERLTAMFWWCREQLRKRRLPVSWVDLIHAGLSESHQEQSTRRFAEGKTRLWLGTEKIGAGIDFPHVKLVVQYCCRDLTLVQWEQRRGRAGRGEGNNALGILLVEKSMTGRDGKLSVTSPGFEDPGLIELIQASAPSCLTSLQDEPSLVLKRHSGATFLC
ncbi:hypothetical protein D9611_008129 [Ephemerocybe angulata]|uniref:DNA 3'-5' helicase n=1 Tax=Ephemerocybe angulata TaxID=980116 RepID=A0A8H5FD12_9AGAR|nr:hypothetical protein D9611_008129 [Tulosesus angulatus]